MNISRFATAAITAALLLPCPSGAASSEDDTTDERHMLRPGLCCGEYRRSLWT